MEEDDYEGKKVHFDDWMGAESDNENLPSQTANTKNKFDKIFADDKFSKREKKGHLLLQLQKTYKGDDRFKLDKDFEADDTKKLPSNMLGSLSTREYQDLITMKKKPKTTDDEPAAIVV